MIRFENVSKSFATRVGRTTVADRVDVTFPSKMSVALLGRNGAGKSTMLDMIGGVVKPDRGRIVTEGSVSWRVGYAGSFHKDLTGAQNIRFVARIYGVDTESLLDFVRSFADLGAQIDSPVRHYSSGMKSRMAFGVSIGIPFDTYLVDEVTSVGDSAFKAKSRRFFEARMKEAGAVVVSHSTKELRKLCQAGAVLENGDLIYFDDIDEAIDRHEENMKREKNA